MNANEVKQEVLSWLNNIPENCWMIEAGIKGVTTGLLNNALNFDSKMKEANLRRHQFLGFLFRDILNKPMASAISAKELNEEMWYALAKWAEPHKDQDSGVWVGRDGLNEAVRVCWQAIEEWEREMSGQLGFLEDK